MGEEKIIHREKDSEQTNIVPLSNRHDDLHKSTNCIPTTEEQKLEYIHLLKAHCESSDICGIEEINGLPYLFPVKDKNDFIYSIDMIRVKFKLKSPADTEFLMNMVRDTETYVNPSPYSFEYIERRKWYQYHHNFNFKLPSCNDYGEMVHYKRSFYMGISINGSDRSNLLQGVLEFNPNKTDGAVVRWLLKILADKSKWIKIQRFDFAVDIPCEKQQVRLLKDSRHYKLVAPSADINTHTEYLGVHQKSGFVKLYNKQIESQLNTPVTRLEMTSEHFDYQEFIRQFPNVYVLGNSTLFPFAELGDTDLVLYHCLRNNPEKESLFNMLGRKKKDKLKKYLYQDENDVKIEIEQSKFYELIRFYSNYLKLKDIFAGA